MDPNYIFTFTFPAPEKEAPVCFSQFLDNGLPPQKPRCSLHKQAAECPAFTPAPRPTLGGGIWLDRPEIFSSAYWEDKLAESQSYWDDKMAQAIHEDTFFDDARQEIKCCLTTDLDKMLERARSHEPYGLYGDDQYPRANEAPSTDGSTEADDTATDDDWISVSERLTDDDWKEACEELQEVLTGGWQDIVGVNEGTDLDNDWVELDDILVVPADDGP